MREGIGLADTRITLALIFFYSSIVISGQALAYAALGVRHESGFCKFPSKSAASRAYCYARPLSAACLAGGYAILAATGHTCRMPSGSKVSNFGKIGVREGLCSLGKIRRSGAIGLDTRIRDRLYPLTRDLIPARVGWVCIFLF